MTNAVIDRIEALNHSHWFRWAWRLAVTLAVSGWILSRLDLAQFGDVLVAPGWGALVAMVLVAPIFVLLGAIKLWVLLRALVPVRLRAIIGYFLVATSFGAFTPAALGDFSIAALLRREGVPAHQGLSVMLVDRGISVTIYALVFTPLTIALFIDAEQLWWLAAIFFIFVVIVMLLNTLQTVRRSVRTRIVRHVPPLEKLSLTLSDLLRLYPFHLAGNIVLTLLRSIVAGLVIQLALLAAHEQPSLFPVICATNFLSIVNLLPISLGGVGVYEGSGVVLFERLGLNGTNVLVALLYQRAYIVISSLLIVATYAVWRSKNVARGSSR